MARALGFGTALLVHNDDVWREGIVVSCTNGWTVQTSSGAHQSLSGEFVLQRAVQLNSYAPGQEIFLATPTAGEFRHGVVISVDYDSVTVVAGNPGEAWRWVAEEDAATDDNSVHVQTTDGRGVALEVLDLSAMVSTSVCDLRCGPTWLRFESDGATGVALSAAQVADADGVACPALSGTFNPATGEMGTLQGALEFAVGGGKAELSSDDYARLRELVPGLPEDEPESLAAADVAADWLTSAGTEELCARVARLFVLPLWTELPAPDLGDGTALQAYRLASAAGSLVTLAAAGRPDLEGAREELEAALQAAAGAGRKLSGELAPHLQAAMEWSADAAPQALAAVGEAFAAAAAAAPAAMGAVEEQWDGLLDLAAGSEGTSEGGASVLREMHWLPDFTAACDAAKAAGAKVADTDVEAVRDAVLSGAGDAGEALQTAMGEVCRFLPPARVEDLQQSLADAAEQGAQFAGQAADALAPALELAAERMEELLPAAAAAAAGLGDDALEEARNAALALSNALDVARERGADISDEVVEQAREAMAAAAPMAEDVAEALREGLGAAVSKIPPEAVAAVHQSAAAAAAAGFEAAEALPDALESAVEAARDAGEVLAPLAETLAVAGTDAAFAGAEAAQAALANIDFDFDVDALQSALGGAFEASWDVAEEAYAASEEVIGMAMEAGAECCGAALDWLKVDVIRDFFQGLGLFFASMLPLQAAKAFWGNLSGLVSFDFNYVFSVPPIAVYVMVAVLAVACLCGFCWFSCVVLDLSPDEIREGYEVKTWDERAKTQSKTVTAVKVLLFGITSAYLPVSRATFQILACDASLGLDLQKIDKSLRCSVSDGYTTEAYGVHGSDVYDKCFDDFPCTCDCGAWKGYQYLQYFAYFLLVSMVLGVPILFYRVIEKNKPVGSQEDPNMRYDEDGLPQEYTDEMFQHDIRSDPKHVHNPLTVLFKGYERKFAHYKVWVMLAKLTLCLPVIFLATKPNAQAGATLAILVAWAALSYWAAPFVSRQADIMDQSARIASSLTVALALLAALNVMPDFCMVLVNLVNAVNFVVLIVFFVIGLPPVYLWWKNFRGILTFSDTCRDVAGSWQSAEHGDMLAQWDTAREVKHRVWHAFWNSLFATTLGDEAKDRLHELLHLTAEKGLHRIKEHFACSEIPEFAAAMEALQSDVEGVDVFWDGEAHDGHLDSATCFGKMYVVPYPFTAVMVYDDADDYTFVHGEADVIRLLELQSRDDIVARREIRQKLRALSNSRVHFEFEQMESHSVPDGTETYEDSEGNTQTRERHTSVQVLMHYRYGTLMVEQSKGRWSAGFSVTLFATDGEGWATAPHTGQQHQVHGSTTIGHSQLGIHSDFRLSSELQTLLEDPENAPVWERELPGQLQEAADYRADLLAQRAQRESVLSHRFWFYVYNNEHLSRGELESYLASQETNDVLRELPAQQARALDYLYGRMRYVTAHPATALWFTFWDDVWKNNYKMNAFQEGEGVADVFNPSYSTCVCYTPLAREQLGELLNERDMSGLFPDAMLDRLYSLLGAATAAASAGAVLGEAAAGPPKSPSRMARWRQRRKERGYQRVGGESQGLMMTQV